MSFPAEIDRRSILWFCWFWDRECLMCGGPAGARRRRSPFLLNFHVSRFLPAPGYGGVSTSVLCPNCPSHGNESYFQHGPRGYRSHENLRCSKSNAILRNCGPLTPKTPSKLSPSSLRSSTTNAICDPVFCSPR